ILPNTSSSWSFCLHEDLLKKFLNQTFCFSSLSFAFAALVALLPPLNLCIHLNKSDLYQSEQFSSPVWKDPPNHLLLGTQAITDLNLPCTSM
ncbi:hypothetical protein Tco_0258929, partial [Tanacetum coccineum]